MLGHVVPERHPNVRETPGGRILENGTLSPGDPVVVFSVAGDYLRCLTPKYLGHVWSAFVKLDEVGTTELEAQVTELEAAIPT